MLMYEDVGLDCVENDVDDGMIVLFLVCILCVNDK